MTKSALFLLPSKESPSSRFRVLQYLPYLEADGWKVLACPCVPSSEPPARDGLLRTIAHGVGTIARLQNRLSSVLSAPAFDLVFIERELLPPFTPAAEEFVRLMNRNMVFDFDDSIFLRYADRDVNPVAAVVSMANTVVVGNEFLGEWALRHNDNVWVLPTAVDTERFVPDSVRGDGRLLVWTGLSSGLETLKFTRPALTEIGRRYPDLRLRIVSDRPPSFDVGLPVEFVSWSTAVEVDAVRSADIGIMPMPDDDWTKGKCAYKVLQYMACGLPTIAAPWGVISDVIDAGRCGLPAQDTAEWIEALDRFISDAELRAQAGQDARRRAEEIYSIKAIYPRWRDVLEMIVEQKRGVRV